MWLSEILEESHKQLAATGSFDYDAAIAHLDTLCSGDTKLFLTLECWQTIVNNHALGQHGLTLHEHAATLLLQWRWILDLVGLVGCIILHLASVSLPSISIALPTFKQPHVVPLAVHVSCRPHAGEDDAQEHSWDLPICGVLFRIVAIFGLALGFDRG